MDWKKFFFSFGGRISRKAFWLFVVANIALNLIVGFVTPQPQIDPAAMQDPSAVLNAALAATPWWSWLLSLVLLFVSLAVASKRWHDQERSGWWSLLLLLTPLLLIGPLIMIVMLGFIPGTPGPNRFGEAPIA